MSRFIDDVEYTSFLERFKMTQNDTYDVSQTCMPFVENAKISYIRANEACKLGSNEPIPYILTTDYQLCFLPIQYPKQVRAAGHIFFNDEEQVIAISNDCEYVKTDFVSIFLVLCTLPFANKLSLLCIEPTSTFEVSAHELNAFMQIIPHELKIKLSTINDMEEHEEEISSGGWRAPPPSPVSSALQKMSMFGGFESKEIEDAILPEVLISMVGSGLKT